MTLEYDENIPAIPVRLLSVSAKLPQIKHVGDGGADIASIEDITLTPHERRVVHTGVSIALPIGYACFIVPRSGLAAKNGITIVNAPGLVDAGYRGEIQVILLNTSDAPFRIHSGDRIAQMVIHRISTPIFQQVETLDDTDRGADGFGSTGTL